MTFLSFFIFLFFLFLKPAFAEGEFITDVTVDYKIASGGNTTIVHNITLQNALTNIYATSYTLSLENLSPKNVQAFQGSTSLPVSENKTGTKDEITISFPDAVVGKGSTRTFSISFDEDSFAVKTGEIWEISIPRVATGQSYHSYTTHIFVPNSFGKEAYISPKPTNVKAQGNFMVYTYTLADAGTNGITAGFGDFQVFSFVLNYHLENPLARTSTADIAIPPDTDFQKMYYSTISPTPQKVSVDADGNWIATYELKSRETKDIKATGSVQIFSGYRPFTKTPKDILNVDLKPTDFWQSDNPQIVSLAKSLQTPKSIYDYVSTTLSYDYARVQPNVERLGALKALQNPKNAICMEYTDLFIALARAAGIPAREINGYAYTENPQIQPLSLVADVLHAWPEYWDTQKEAWIPVDPTWGSTTKGIDYFNKLDLRHFTFVIHGQSSTKPYPPGSYKLGTNPQKDVFVNFGSLPDKRVSYPQISYVNNQPLPFLNNKILVKVYNPGPVALYNLTPDIVFDSKDTKGTTIDVLPPYATYDMVLNVPFSFLGNKTPDKIQVILLDQRVEIPTFKQQVIIYNLLAIFLIFALIVGAIVLRIKRVSLYKVYSKLFLRHAKPNQKPPETTQTQTKS